LQYFPPDPEKAGGAAIIVCPGGGYRLLTGHEGAGYARWLAENGVAAFVLKYRLHTDGYRYPAMFLDAARAVRTVRARSAGWGIDPRRIGIMGSSAGGHLATLVMTQFDAGRPDAADPVERASSRPDLGVLCYALIVLGKANPAHPHRHPALIEGEETQERLDALSTHLNVQKNSPPCFIWQTMEDSSVGPANSLLYAQALHEKRIPFELHIYQKGAHGMGLGGAAPHPWAEACLDWLKVQGFVRAGEEELIRLRARPVPKGAK
jgi:acetyl esterase/lipase